MTSSSPSLTIGPNGVQEWRLPSGALHREDGPAAIRKNGTEYWYFNGDFHRPDGPAIIVSDGTLQWWRHGKLHRTDGPAYIGPIGEHAWWVNDNLVLDPSERLTALWRSNDVDSLRLILEVWSPNGPTIDDLADAVAHVSC